MAELETSVDDIQSLPFDLAEHTLPFDQIERSQVSLFAVVRDVLSLSVGLATLLASLGFTTVSGYLSKFTDIQGYGVDVGQFVAAGVEAAVALSIIAIIILTILYVLHSKATLAAVLDIFSTVSDRVVAFLAIVFFLGAFGFIYGRVFYTNDFANFGEVPTVILVLKDNLSPSLFGLTPDAVFPQRTQALELLAEFNDGILVKAGDGTVALVKNDVIFGVLDDDKISVSPLVTTSTPVVTPIIAPSATP